MKKTYTFLVDIDDAKTWNRFIATHNPWSFFQSYWWGEQQKLLGVEVVRFQLNQNSTTLVQAQAMLVRAKRGMYLHLRQGPVFATNLIGVDRMKAFEHFTQQLKMWAQKRQMWFIRISPMIENSPENNTLLLTQQFIPSPIAALDAELCWVLSLEKSEEELLSGMRKTTRYSIRQAEKLGVKVFASDDIDSFIALYLKTAHRHAFVPHKGIREEYQLFNKNGKALLLFATYQRTLLSAALCIEFANQLIYHHGCSLPGKIPASYLLQWYAIREAKKKQLTYYNFWGIAPDGAIHHPWQGITLFKQGFGGKSMQFLHAHDLPLSPLYSVTRAIEFMQKKRRGL